MRVGNFAVIVPEGREKDSGHVQIPHNTKFRVQLKNHWHNRRCDAVVTMDGKVMGTFRVDNHGSITLERPSHDEGCFTFYRADTPEYEKASGGEVSEDLRGLVQVVFKPEKAQQVQMIPRTRSIPEDAWKGQGSQTLSVPQNCSAPPVTRSTQTKGLEREEKTSGGIVLPMSATKAGVTGLSGHSSQRFIEVAELDYDRTEEVTVSLRLVAWDDGPRPLTSAAPKANPVPAPVA